MNEINLFLKERYYQTAARNLFLNREFFEILDAFSKENIPLIPLKGIALIQKIYSDIGGRYIGDIDILIKAKDVLPAVKILNKLGYNSPVIYFNPDKPYSIYLNSLPFSKYSKIPYFIHLHWHILNTTIPLFMYRIDMEDIWKESKPERCQDKEILMMAAQHQVIYLSIHAFNHSFNKISLFSDIQKVIEFYKDKLDWKTVDEVAKDWGAVTPLYYSLSLTSKILSHAGITISKSGMDMAKLISSISEDKLGSHNLVYSLYLDMAGGFLNKIKFVFLTFFPYPEQLCRMYSVKSKNLVYLYYFKRLWRGLMGLIKDKSTNSSSQN